MIEEEHFGILPGFDPESVFYLKVVEGRYFVFRVDLDGGSYILKASANDFAVGIQHLTRDAEVLRLAQDIDELPSLVWGPSVRGSHTLTFKEYTEGRIMRYDEVIQDNLGRQELESVVDRLHEKKVTRLDIEPKNVVISPNGPRLFEFSYCLLKREISWWNFRSRKRKDFRRVAKLYGE